MPHHTPRRFPGSIFALMTIGLAPGVTWAASPDDNPAVVAPPNRWQKPFALEGQLGFGAPLGLAGVALDVTPVPWVSLNVGVGQGGGGAQYAGMARVRLARTPVTGGVGAGVSAGRYLRSIPHCSFPGPCTAEGRPIREWDPAIWGNVEAFLEGRAAGGFQWRVYIGLGRILNGAAPLCTGHRPGDERPNRCDGIPVIGYVGTALGYSFSL